MKLKLAITFISAFILIFLVSCTGGAGEDTSSLPSESNPTADETPSLSKEEVSFCSDDNSPGESSEPEMTDSSSLSESSETEISNPESSEPEISTEESSEPGVIEESDGESEPDIVIPKDSVHISDIKASGRELTVYGTFDSGKKQKELFKKLNKELDEYGGNISLIVWSTDGSKALSYNTNERFFTASTIKIAYALSCCFQIDEGIFDKNTKITYEEKHHHDGGGEIKNQPFGTEYTIEELINKCISISDNVAYEMLVDHFGYDYYNNMMGELGCDSITLRKGKLWSHKALTTDFLVVWNELYEYFGSGAPMAEILKNACTNTVCSYATQTLNRRKIDYSHKEGDNHGAYPAYNDSGIIWDEVPYIFVIFTNSDSREGDRKTMTDVMNAVFDIMDTPRLKED